MSTPKPKGLSFGPDKKSMLALGDAVAARLAMDRDFDLIDPEEPAPDALVLEGATLAGMATGWIGVYERQRGREMKDGAPAYRHINNPVLWIARDDEGTWRGQYEGKLGQRVSQLKLVDKSCVNPCSPSEEAWQYLDPATSDWEKSWSLRCRAAEADEVEVARTKRPAEPTLLSFEGCDPGGLSALAVGYLGLYTRGKELNEKKETVDRDVNHSPCWRNVANPMLYLARGSDGGWVAQGEVSLGTQDGVMRLRDNICALPTMSAQPWLAFDGKGWRPMAGLQVREATEDEVAKAMESQPPPPPGFTLSVGEGETASDFEGTYELQEGHVNKSAAYRRVIGPQGEERERHEDSKWLVRGRNGCWVGQLGRQLGLDSGALQRPHTGLTSPCDSSGSVAWQEYMQKTWRDIEGMQARALLSRPLEALRPAAPPAEPTTQPTEPSGEAEADASLQPAAPQPEPPVDLV
uniref:Uncharacterized protein n=1 Tax=Haptolina brevifila TaxID=156173 RepID=A0A7S2HYU7_9EUKA|mmetsp:Transcript_58929/g.117087  ORF Transcript_58929/g.117087 Transcript_58929/m.117087 type:complete len:464 (+) Transcript_58929:34-1425(+)|eukprot:CAMPEP_0174713070 /NCGR_PEP_ID=MMETSP1094-20130205/13863_1 /TAXON_ID=156173 /ORGANISM="Chrysochromulina brevifilum, Strain UTEX LB 985" /LENGTH=463 /DNA_ID=CAMNT_0015912215 /DNA_START=32 /DNA_END=1423 /DNA_ORIENTATION=-